MECLRRWFKKTQEFVSYPTGLLYPAVHHCTVASFAAEIAMSTVQQNFDVDSSVYPEIKRKINLRRAQISTYDNDRCFRVDVVKYNMDIMHSFVGTNTATPDAQYGERHPRSNSFSSMRSDSY